MNTYRGLLSCGCVALVSPLVSAQARAETFGQPGQIVVSTGAQGSVEHLSWSPPSGRGAPPSSTSVSIAPAADAFVLPGLSVGAQIAYYHQETSGLPATNEVFIGPRVGYNVALGDRFSFWPVLRVGYTHLWLGGASTDNSVSVGGYAPILYHPTTHLFLGLGPNAQYAATMTAAGGSVTQYGALLTVGGWLEP